jgi:hypothetical protein
MTAAEPQVARVHQLHHAGGGEEQWQSSKGG